MQTLAAVGVALLTSVAVWLLVHRAEKPAWPGALAAGSLAFAGVTSFPALLAGPAGEGVPARVPLFVAIGVALLVVQIVAARRRWSERTAALERWNHRLGALLSRGPVWAAWLHEHRLRFVSDGLAAELGRPAEACAGLPLEDLFDSSDIARMRPRAEPGEPVADPWQTELTVPGSDRRIPVEVTAVVGQRDAAGAGGWGLVLRDMREAIRARDADLRRLRLETLLSAISNELLRAEPRDLGPAIERALGFLGEFAGADRASTRVIDEKESDLVLRCQLWVAPGIDRARSPDQIGVAEGPALRERLRRGEVVRIPQSEEGPVEESLGSSVLARAGARSAVIFPLRVGADLSGGCVLAWEQQDCPLAAEDTRGLQLAVDAIGSALARQRAAKTLHRQEELLLQAQRMEAVGVLAGGIAHDFNNLLTVITGYAESLRLSARLDDEQRQQVEQIARAGERAAALTSRLVAFGRRQRREPRNLDLGERVAALEPVLRRSLGESIELVIESQAGLPAVLADSGQVDQVVLNLVLNARDAMGERGRITVRTLTQHAPGGRVVCLEVADDGRGIAPEDRDRLFEPFFTTKPVGQGTGLGLAMVHSIVRQGGGSIEVESEVGSGTVFRVALPAAEGVIADPLTPLPAPGMPAGVRGRILLVEDEQAVRDLAVYALRAAGFAVAAAADGDQGLQLAREDVRGFDAIVTDVVMLRRSGPEMVAQLPERYRDVPVLFISGYHRAGSDDQRLAAVSEIGKTRLLEKPFTPKQLVEQLHELLRS
ncbi:MAG TPA: ATP-binding protein [Thermoanaerobaculia bacterium]|nr:ATP-binding protein [Thermoanaerobaculia bacterium]